MDGPAKKDARLVLVNRRPDQRRVALIEGGLTTELFFERLDEHGIVGNIYKGRVVRVLPGMQCAFLDLGLVRTAFLYVTDALPAGADHSTAPPIQELVQQGQELLVQVTREALGEKGAKVTTRVHVPGRYLVFHPESDQINISRRIEDVEERARLQLLAEEIAPAKGGLIVRTAATGVRADELKQDLGFLERLWQDIAERASTASPPACVHEDLDVALRSVRDLLTAPGDRVLVDHPEEETRIREFVRRTMPGFEDAVEGWKGPDPLFERFGLEWEISRAVRRTVWLPSGGSVVLDHTEALTAIDVNSARYVGKEDLSETVRRINLEAVKEIAYLLRLRDIGGLIVIDFIDMANPEHQAEVSETLVRALEADKARTRVLPMSEFGLVEMTRKRVRDSIVQGLTESCFYCEGRGYLRAVEVTADGIVSRLHQLTAGGARGDLEILAHPKVIDALESGHASILALMEQEHGMTIRVVRQVDMHLEEAEIL